MERQAQMATRGEYFALGQELSRMRRTDVDMNTPCVWSLDKTGTK
jgi:hypothetical protein